MNSLNRRRRAAAFTLSELVVAMGVFSVFSAALLTIWISMQSASLNVTMYARRQNDQMRVLDYLARDIRRASSIQVYQDAAPVSGATLGNEVRVTLPDAYADTREEDHALGSNIRTPPVLTAGKVTYGSAITVRYYVSGGAVIREEAGTARTIGQAAGAFALS